MKNILLLILLMAMPELTLANETPNDTNLGKAAPMHADSDSGVVMRRSSEAPAPKRKPASVQVHSMNVTLKPQKNSTARYTTYRRTTYRPIYPPIRVAETTIETNGVISAAPRVTHTKMAGNTSTKSQPKYIANKAKASKRSLVANKTKISKGKIAANKSKFSQRKIAGKKTKLSQHKIAANKSKTSLKGKAVASTQKRSVRKGASVAPMKYADNRAPASTTLAKKKAGLVKSKRQKVAKVE